MTSLLIGDFCFSGPSSLWKSAVQLKQNGDDSSILSVGRHKMIKKKIKISLDDIQIPHISLQSGYWMCAGSGVYMYGPTPVDAYAEWKRVVHKFV